MQTSSEPLIASKRISTTLGSRIPSFYVERHLQRSLYLCVDNRNDCLSSLRRITWFIPGLLMVIQKENMFVSVIDGRTSRLCRTFCESSIAPGNDCNVVRVCTQSSLGCQLLAGDESRCSQHQRVS